MHNPIRDYDWGSRTTLARMQGREPPGRPEAELWMGAHASAPSCLRTDNGHLVPMDRLVEEHPAALLGDAMVAAFGARLPFLLKVLAIAKPLSLQVHPGAERARTAFADEALIDGNHRYVDPYPKPELLYALEPVDALCGFRTAETAAHLLGLLPGDRIARVAADLDAAAAPDETGTADPTARPVAALRTLVTWPEDDRPALAAEIARGCRTLLTAAGSHRSGALSSQDRRAMIWARRLADHFPGDPLVAAPFLLDLVRLEPGETLFVPAGAPHAYLHGTGVEIMGNSDNVLRAGLTHKAVAVEELLHVVDGGTRPVRDVPEKHAGPHEVIWRPAVEEFQLSRLELPDAGEVTCADLVGPQIVLCTAGQVTVSCDERSVRLGAGESAFVGPDELTVRVTGPGQVFRAAAGLD